jgi:hypothetical protein
MRMNIERITSKTSLPVTTGSVIKQYRFYEKVVKVKADVAAILRSFLPLDHLRPRPTSGRLHIGRGQHGGSRKCASIRSFLRLRRFGPSICRGLATSTSWPQPATTSRTHAECVPTSITTRAGASDWNNSAKSCCVVCSCPPPARRIHGPVPWAGRAESFGGTRPGPCERVA